MDSQLRQNMLKAKTIKISCVVPVYNEAAVILTFIDRLYSELQTLGFPYEIIIVDDGSTDETYSLIKNLPLPELKLIKLSRNFGKEIALSAGLHYPSGDITILLDGDLQHPPHLINNFLTHWAEGYDMVYGIRDSYKTETAIKRFCSTLFYKIMRHLTDIDITPNAGDFRLLDKKVVQTINACHEKNLFMKGIYAWVGFKKIGIPFQAQKRFAGTSAWKFKRLLELALTGITAFSNIPLRIWSIIGLIIFTSAFISILSILIKIFYFNHTVAAHIIAIMTIILFSGLQIFAIGVIGEYIARIFNEVKQRPNYIIAEKHGFRPELNNNI